MGRIIFCWMLLFCWATTVATGEEVTPYRLDFIDFSRGPVNVGEAEGRRVLTASHRIILRHFPLPRKEAPLHVYVKVKPENEADALFLETMAGDERVTLSTLSGMAPGVWQWVAMPAFDGERITGTVRFDAVPSREAGRPISIEAMVVSTIGGLEAAELDRAPALLTSAPFATVYHTSTPPKLDASGKDPVWARAFSIRDFLIFETHQPASLDTAVRLLYDSEYLYLQWVIDEPLLRAADMRIEELVTLAKERDATTPYDVLADDSCMLILQPGGEGPLFEFAVNSLGILLDAQLDPQALWEERNPAWNAEGLRLVQKRHEAHWICEMAIPFRALGVAPPRVGEEWSAALSRLAPGRKESSSWNLTGRGAHRPQNLGTLRFAGVDEVAGVAITSPLKELAPGRTPLGIRLNGETPMLAYSLTGNAAGKQLFSETELLPSAGSEQHHDVESPEGSGNSMRWGLVSADRLERIYQSATAQMATRSSKIGLELDTTGSYEVYLNGVQVASGQEAARRSIPLRLRRGANGLAIRASSGKATATLKGGPGETLPQAWYVAPEADDWNPEDTNSAGALLTNSAELALPDGSPEKALIATRIILDHHTAIWPLPEPSLAIARGMYQPATFRFNGLQGRDLADWTTWVAVPKELKVEGVSGFYARRSRERQPEFNLTPVGEVEMEGKALALYTITASRPLFYDPVHPPGGRTGMFHLMLKVDPEAIGLESGRIYYWSQAEQGAVAERMQSFAVQALPPVRGKQPRHYVFELWGSNLGQLDSEAVRLQALESIQTAGFNVLMDHDAWVVTQSPRFGLKVRATISFVPWSINLKPYLDAHPEERLVRHDGSRHDHLLCTTLLLDEKWPVAEEAMSELIRKNGYPSVVYDYEYSPWTGPHACFCPRCLEQFAKEKSLSGPLDAEEIDQSHRAVWDDFMARQGARVTARMRAATKRIIPDGELAIFSLPQSPRTVSVYGVDWRYIVGEGGADIVQIGTSGSWEEITATSQVVGDTPVMYGVWIKPYQLSHMAPAEVATKAELLRRVLDSTRGILFYDRATMDGHSWLNVGEITRLVADYEPVFLEQRPEPVEGYPARDAQWMRGKDDSLLCLMNPGNKEQRFEINLPAEALQTTEYFSGRSETPRQGVLSVTLPPHESAVYIFRNR